MTTFTEDDLAAISSAIATGARRVRFQTHEVEYHSLADMKRARDLIRAEIAGDPTSGGLIFTEYHDGAQ